MGKVLKNCSGEEKEMEERGDGRGWGAGVEGLPAAWSSATVGWR